MAKYKVLSTKKLDPSLVEKAEQNDIEIIEQEFISVRPIVNEEIFQKIIGLAETGKQFIVFTSSHAVSTVARYLHKGDTHYVVDWKIFCLSGKTREAVINDPLLKKNIVGEAINASLLAQKIIAQGIKEIIFFCGDKRREELPVQLKEAGITVHEVVVYETLETPAPAVSDPDGILFFSPSAVNSFFSVNQLKQHTVCFAIGATTAEAIGNYTNNRIITSEGPSQEMMLASVYFYFKNINC